MGVKEYEFGPQDLLHLLTHYTDGEVPISGECVAVLQHPHLVRKIGLIVQSEEWTEGEPLFLGYDGKRTMSWSKSDGGEPVWEQREETPRRQS